MERVISVLFLSLEIVISQYSQSPCPEIFDYRSDGSTIYGAVSLTPGPPVSSLHIRTNFTVAAQLFSNYVGKIEAENSDRFLQRYNAGMPVSYRIHLPITSPLPRLTDLSVNGQTICYGPADYPGPGQYVTSLSLEHTSFIQGGPFIPTRRPSYPTPQKRPSGGLDYNGNLGDNAQVFTFNSIDNQPWNTNDYTPSIVVNNERPIYNQSPTPIFNPSRPIYAESNPIYEPTRPQNVPSIFTRPTYDQPISRPTYPSRTTTRRPVYTIPTTAPTIKPNVLDSIFSPDFVTEEPVGSAVNRNTDATHPSRNFECGEVAGGNERVPLIYSGKSYEIGEIPWLVAIFKGRRGNLNFACGGTLVSDRHVITAAHCMHLRSQLTSIQSFVIKVGVHDLDDWSSDITVTRSVIDATIHESYNATTLENDILVFTLNKRIDFNTYIRPVCLWTGNTDLSRVVGASGVVAGWGDRGNSAPIGQGLPQMVTIPIVSHAQCKASKAHFHHITSTKTLCAGDRNGAGPCRGDSGGGLYLLEDGKWRLRGVVSVSLRHPSGDNTCNLNEYIVFTDTAQYLTWIRNVMSKKYYD